MGIVGDFPQVPIGIGKIAGVSTPEHLPPVFDKPGPGPDRMGKDAVDFFGAVGVPGEADTAKGGRLACRKSSIMRQVRMAEDGEHHAIDIKKPDMLIAHAMLCESKPLIERLGAPDIGDAKRHEIQPGFHAVPAGKAGQWGWRLLMKASRPSQAAPSSMFFTITAAEVA